MNKVFNKVVALVVLASPGLTYAAVDVTSTVAEIGTAAVAVLAIGVAVITVKVGIKLYKWASAAL